mmetsp:Transcript_27332/g.35410  ORF Transcript_27332/g.35410 Transcript_27332/m.35410 type:complete len:136 (+) Transcript_27332:103-510(+)
MDNLEIGNQKVLHEHIEQFVYGVVDDTIDLIYRNHMDKHSKTINEEVALLHSKVDAYLTTSDNGSSMASVSTEVHCTCINCQSRANDGGPMLSEFIIETELSTNTKKKAELEAHNACPKSKDQKRATMLALLQKL